MEDYFYEESKIFGCSNGTSDGNDGDDGICSTGRD